MTDRLCEMCGKDEFYGHVCIPCRMKQFRQIAADIRDMVEHYDVDQVTFLRLTEVAERIEQLSK